uniref:Peroxidase n=1 Tax=Opuntia streptacantha TaxID=393608 RepID=A0A7C8ZRR0_OPUST
MRVNVAAPATAPSLSPRSPSSSSSSPRNAAIVVRLRRSQSFVFGSKSTAQGLRRSCSANFEGHDLTQKRHTLKNTTEKLQQLNRPISRTTSFKQLGAQVDVLEPSLLGIKPEPPQWPAREEVIRDCIARRASSIDIPLSLRMIKLKQRIQKLEEERENGELGLGHDSQNPISNMCCNTLHIIREVQSQALKIRGLVLDEDLDGIAGKVQKEMTSSFVWLFREVFAKTPDLMVQVMVLTSNFAAYSLETVPEESVETQEDLGSDSRNWGVGQLELGKSGVPTEELLDGMDEREVGLWNSLVEEANEMNEGYVKDPGLGYVDRLREHKLGFVSPVSVEIQKDEYAEYYSTNLLYQIGLSQDPNNPLLLSNYAQFLWLVSRDYDRAEECFKRAIQLDPGDAEVISQYANFLWLVREDLWGAEERFQQAMAAEPENSFHASRYASFLWNTGAEDTCYPLDSPQDMT